jgi:hypothetical protein
MGGLEHYKQSLGRPEYSDPSSIAGDTFIEEDAFGESALEELHIIWDSRGYENEAVESQSK